MSLRTTARGSIGLGQLYNLLATWYWSPTLRFALFQGMVIALVGVGLGAVVVVATSASVVALFVLVMAALAPFFLVIAAKLVGDMKLLFVVVMLLEIQIGVDINIGFNEITSNANSLSGINVSVTTLSLVFLYIWWIAEIATGDTKDTPALYLWDNPSLLAYVLAAILSIFVATSMIQSLVEINLLIQALLLYLYLVYAIRTREAVLTVAMCIVVGLLLQSLIMIALHFIGFTIELGPIAFTVWKNNRVAGTLSTPNGAGAYLVMALVTTLSVTLMPVRWQYKWLATIAFGLGVLALLVTYSRGAWLGFAVALSLFLLLAWWRGWISIGVPLAMILCAIPVAIVFREAFINRLFGDDGGAAESRLPLMIMAVRMIRDHLFFGVGINNFAIHLRQYATPEMTLDWITTVHNKYLLVWAETGLFGIVTFLWFLLSTLRRGWQAWKIDDRLFAPLALGCLAGLVGWMVHMNLDLFHGRPIMEMLVIVCALFTTMRTITFESANA